MKILWLSNRLLDKADNGSTGTWLFALVNAFKNTEDLHLGNIADADVSEILYNKFDNVEQWQIPNKAAKNNGLPHQKYEKAIIKLIKDFHPDVIHVWGLEHYWGFITRKLVNDYPVIIEIQGLKKDLAKVYSGELSFKEKLKCIGIKELVKFETIFNKTRKFYKWGIIERKIIKSHKFFSTHSQWAEAQVKELNPGCVMFKNERLLRNEFYNAEEWNGNNLPVIFTSLGYAAPFKGLFTLIKAIEVIKQKYPNIILNIAGALQLTGLRRDGYMNFLKTYIQKNNLQGNIEFAGPLNGMKIIENLHKSSIAVFPSYVESYGIALAECMAVGVPLVASYNGGYSYLGKDNENLLFFSPGDYAMCAFQIDKILSNRDLSKRLGDNARTICLKRNDPTKILDKQIYIYKRAYNEYNKINNEISAHI